MFLTLLACQSKAPLVLLVSMDTTRADRIGAYGHPDAGTPNLDGLAERGVLFETALAPSSTTLLSHTAVFSGRDSHKSAVVRNGYPVPHGLPLLAERFAEAGWDTIGVVGATPLEESMGLARGFRVWQDHGLLAYLGTGEVRGDVVNERVFEALDAADSDDPTLLFVHYYDAHMPWNSAPRETVRRFVPPESNGFVVGGLLPDARRLSEMTDVDRAEVNARYQAEISWTDSQFGELLAGLEKRDRLEDALIVVFSDHGETMGDNPTSLHPYGHGHGPDVDMDIIHVPLVIAGTGDFEVPVGQRIARQVRLLDIGTTVLGLTELSGALGDGEDLAPLWSGSIAPAPPSFAEATKPIPREAKSAWNNRPFQRSVAHEGELLVITPLQGTSSLRDLRERTELTDEARRAELTALLREWDQNAPPHREPKMSDATITALKKLGYLE
ncbi:MAG: sulfatase [Proteobacteria bacterium]|nr:sulfatase [Pseudomonadota bacterium]MCP4919780.1 sulfatase [Pseudomonadota bacterium]